MKRSISLITVSLLLCTGCSQGTMTHQQLMDNPLYAERYAEDIVDSVVQFGIDQNPIFEDEEKAAALDSLRERWLKLAEKAQQKQNTGMKGGFIPVLTFTAGEVLILNDTLYFGPDFVATPNPSLHLILSTVVDPRDVEFPDESSIDLGPLVSAYGTQTYALADIENLELYRTLALWDTELEELYGFAQLTN